MANKRSRRQRDAAKIERQSGALRKYHVTFPVYDSEGDFLQYEHAMVTAVSLDGACKSIANRERVDERDVHATLVT